MTTKADAAIRPNYLPAKPLKEGADSGDSANLHYSTKAPPDVDTLLWNISSAKERRELVDRKRELLNESIDTGDQNDSAESATGKQTDKSEEYPQKDKDAPDTTRQPTTEILEQYQVKADEMVFWSPNIAGLFDAKDDIVGKKVTSTEAGLLDQLLEQKGIAEAGTIATILNPYGMDEEINAFRVADQHFPRYSYEYKNAVPVTANLPHPLPVRTPIPGTGDGHNDAMRHAFFNAILTKKYGVEFAESFATAHEGIPKNKADREAMDLFNNELGRRIAVDNPDAAPGVLADLINTAIDNGEAVVIDGKGELVYSDQVAVGKTGHANDSPRKGVISPPAWNPPTYE